MYILSIKVSFIANHLYIYKAAKTAFSTPAPHFGYRFDQAVSICIAIFQKVKVLKY